MIGLLGFLLTRQGRPKPRKAGEPQCRVS